MKRETAGPLPLPPTKNPCPQGGAKTQSEGQRSANSQKQDKEEQINEELSANGKGE